jgi:tape measure domain-containing protein
MAKTFDISILMRLKNELTGPLKKVSKDMEGFRRRMNKIGGQMQDVGSKMTTRLSLPMMALGGLALKASADLETMQVAFESLTGSAEGAEKVMKDLTEFTAGTPFQLEGVGKAAKQLMAAQVPAEELRGKLKYLGDIAAGANVPLEDMASIFTKSKAKGKAMTEELLQLSDRGIPIIDVLAKKMNVSKEEIFDMASKGKVSFEILEDALQSMTKEGGVFANQMEKQSNTLAGIFSTLKDNLQLAFGEIGNILVDTLDLKQVMKDAIGWIQEFVKWLKNISEEHPGLVRIAVIIMGIVAALGPLLYMVGTVVKFLGPLGTGLKMVVTLGTWLIPVLYGIAKGLVTMLIAGGPIVWVLTAIAAIALVIYKNWKPLKRFFKSVFDPVATFVKETWYRLSEFIDGFKDKVVGMFAKVKEIFGKIKDFFANIGKDLGLIEGKAKVSGEITGKSKTDVTVRVKSDKGTEGKVESVRKKEGQSRVTIKSDTALGALGGL